jgi:uncharacterized protein YbjQ (UPF0145 family)
MVADARSRGGNATVGVDLEYETIKVGHRQQADGVRERHGGATRVTR